MLHYVVCRYGPPATNQSALNHAFERWLEESGIPPETAGCTPYVGCVYNTSLLSVVEGGPAQAAAFYYSKRFSHDWGIFNSSYRYGTLPSYHNITTTLKAFQATTGKLGGGLTCANFPPSSSYTDERYVCRRRNELCPRPSLHVCLTKSYLTAQLLHASIGSQLSNRYCCCSHRRHRCVYFFSSVRSVTQIPSLAYEELHA